MPLIGWIGAVLASLLAGAAAGWWFVSRIMTRQYKAKLHRATEAIKQQHAATAARGRAAPPRPRRQVAPLRAGIPRVGAAAPGESRARIARLDEQLKHAHLELDRMRIRLEGAVASQREHAPDGFAQTQTFGNTR